MSSSLRIVVADDEPDMCAYFGKILPRLGYTVVAAAANGKELLAYCRTYRPDLVITDVRMPEMDGLDAARKISSEMLIPIILISAYSDSKLAEHIDRVPVMAHLVKPIRQHDLASAIRLALCRFKQFQLLCREAADLQQAWADRKIVEQAKEVLMKESGVSEVEAFGRLQNDAADRQTTLVEMARRILATSQTGRLS